MGEDDRQGSDRSETRRRYTVTEAAEILGITVEAVRGRIKRGTIEHERTDEGVFVWMDADRSPTGSRPDEDRSDDRAQLVEALRDEISHLRNQLAEEREARRRADTIIAQLTQANATLAARIPELEAPTEPREPPEGAEPRSDRGTTPEEQEQPTAQAQASPRERSWWRRMFGG